MNELEKPILLKKCYNSKHILSLPLHFYEQLNKTENVPTELTFGTNIANVRVRPHASSEFVCELSANVWDQLCLPFESRIRLYIKDRQLHIGPLIGIFTAGFLNNHHRPVGERSLLFAQYLTTATKMGGYFFIFGSHVIDWAHGVISGFFYTKNGWQQHKIPFPHVVYDRIPNRKAEQLPSLQAIKKQMQTNYCIPWFNSGFFNKWTIYEKLLQNDNVNCYLPKTNINPSLTTIEELLNQYKHVYIKPANGSLGIGIYHIIKREKDALYYCRFQHENKTVIKRYDSLTDLFNTHFRVDERSDLVVQQGISLMKVNNRPLDFRIHTNKNMNGQWQVSAIAAKVSGHNCVTTHLAYGGSVKTIKELIQENESFRPYIRKLQNAALLLSEALEEKIDGIHGEFGFDMGIDVQGHIWMFEANSKPGRAIFIHPNLKKEDIITRKMPFEFGTYLTETIITKPESVLT